MRVINIFFFILLSKRIDEFKEKLFNFENNIVEINELKAENEKLQQNIISQKQQVSVLENQNQLLQRELMMLQMSKMNGEHSYGEKRLLIKELKHQVEQWKQRKTINYENCPNIKPEEVQRRPMTAKYLSQSSKVLEPIIRAASPMQQFENESIQRTQSPKQLSTVNKSMSSMKKKRNNRILMNDQQDVTIDKSKTTKSQANKSIEKYISSKTIQNVIKYKKQNPKIY